MKYRVWQPSGMSEVHADEVEAETDIEAAEEWAAKNWEPADGRNLELRVREPGGATRQVQVDVNMQPQFMAFHGTWGQL